jgi:hypothetical protein
MPSLNYPAKIITPPAPPKPLFFPNPPTAYIYAPSLIELFSILLNVLT